MQMLRIGLWEIVHAVVTRRPPISLSTIVARIEGYTYAAKGWAVSLVQGPFPVAPCQTLFVRFATSLYSASSERMEAVHSTSSRAARALLTASQLNSCNNPRGTYASTSSYVMSSQFPLLPRPPALVRVVGGTAEVRRLALLGGLSGRERGE
jgi:hypothetical protein